MEHTEKRKKFSFEDRCEAIFNEKIGNVAIRKENASFGMAHQYLCTRLVNCPSCGFFKEGVCKGCSHMKCSANVCDRGCKVGLEYCRKERCRNGIPDKLAVDEKELDGFGFDEVLSKIRPTKPLHLSTPFIPGVGPYGKLAPGEILKFPEHYVGADDADRIVMVAANQLPLSAPPNVFRPEDINDPEDIFLRDVDFREYLGIQDDVSIILNFRALDEFLMFFWVRRDYDAEKYGYNTLYDKLRDYDIDYFVNINFSIWGQLSMYQNWYNLKRQLLSFVELQDTVGRDIIFELNGNFYNPQLDPMLFDIVNAHKISTVHLNFQMNAEIMTNNICSLNYYDKLNAEEIILGGIGNLRQAMKFKRLLPQKRIYASNLLCYVGTVLQQHVGGFKYHKPIPPSEDEEGRAAYYSELFEENVRWTTTELKKHNLHLPWDKDLGEYNTVIESEDLELIERIQKLNQRRENKIQKEAVSKAPNHETEKTQSEENEGE